MVVGMIFAFVTILLIVYILIVAWRLYFRINEIHKKKTGRGIIFQLAGLNVLYAIFTNEYKEDETYNKLVWQLRVLIPIVIILAFISGGLQ